MNPILNNQEGNSQQASGPSPLPSLSTNFAIGGGGEGGSRRIKMERKEEEEEEEPGGMLGIKQEMEEQVANDNVPPGRFYSQEVEMAQRRFFPKMLEYPLTLVTTSEILPSGAPDILYWTPPRLFLRIIPATQHIYLTNKNNLDQVIEGKNLAIFRAGGNHQAWAPSLPPPFVGSPAVLDLKIDNILYHISFNRKADLERASGYFHSFFP